MEMCLVPFAIFLDSGHMTMLALYQVLFIPITSLWYIGKTFTVSILQMWKLRPKEVKSVGEVGFKPNSPDSKAHAFSTIPCSFLGAIIWNMNRQNIFQVMVCVSNPELK